jgi:hypothetical protein
MVVIALCTVKLPKSAEDPLIALCTVKLPKSAEDRKGVQGNIVPRDNDAPLHCGRQAPSICSSESSSNTSSLLLISLYISRKSELASYREILIVFPPSLLTHASRAHLTGESARMRGFVLDLIETCALK